MLVTHRPPRPCPTPIPRPPLPSTPHHHHPPPPPALSLKPTSITARNPKMAAVPISSPNSCASRCPAIRFPPSPPQSLRCSIHRPQCLSPHHALRHPQVHTTSTSRQAPSQFFHPELYNQAAIPSFPSSDARGGGGVSTAFLDMSSLFASVMPRVCNMDTCVLPW
jgi:hypothetical protein